MGDLAVSPRRLQRLIGMFFLILTVIGPISILYIPTQLASKINKKDDFQALLNQGIIADLVIIVTECFMIPMLYFYFAPAGRTTCLVAAICRFLEVVIMCAMLFAYVGMGVLSAGAVGDVGDASSWISILIFLRAVGVKLWEIPFGISIALIGGLVAFCCQFLPRIFGYLLMVGGSGYVLDAVAGLLYANYAELSVEGNPRGDTLQGLGSGMACFGEIPFFVYVMVNGCYIPAWYQQSAKNSASLLDDQES